MLFFGSLWGINEVIIGEAFPGENPTLVTVWLAVWALCVLAVARGVLNKPGSSIVIASVATLFKLVNAAPFFCHLLGIFTLGVAFDVFATFLMKNERKISFRSSLSGVLSAYGGYTLFALIITYIVRYEYWIEGGFTKVLHHIFESGSFAALGAIVVLPLGYWMGVNVETLMQRRSRLVYAGTLGGLIILWTLGRII